MTVFFLNADQQIYGRYGGRAGDDPDERQSLAGLRYAMEAALKTHRSEDKTIVPQRVAERKTVRNLGGVRRGNCIHCHQVKTMQIAALKRNDQWSRDDIWRYPPPDNLGLLLAVDRGDVVERVEKDSPAQRAGLRPGDVIEKLGAYPIHSFGDAQYALDGAPTKGEIEIAWRRGEKAMDASLALPAGWRKSDLSWRRSMQWVVPSARVFGRNLNAQERRERGLSAKQLAFWQSYPVSKAAQAAGVREQDIILGFDGKELEMDAYGFLRYVRSNYLSGDRVTINVLRGDERLSLPMTLP